MRELIALFALAGSAIASAAAETSAIPLPDDIRDKVKKYEGACADFPNLADVRAVLTEIAYEAGPDSRSLDGASLSIDVYVSVANDTGVDASPSRLGYSAEIWSASGGLVEKLDGSVAMVGVNPYESQDVTVSLETERVAELATGEGALRGTLVFRAEADEAGEVGECDESDNSTELKAEIVSAKVLPDVLWSAPANAPKQHPKQPD